MPIRWGRMFNDWLLAVLVIGCNLAIRFLFKSIQDDRHLKELESQRLKTELNYLKAQVNPHFFMNTLNNIHALIDIDGERAKETVIELSRIMRYVLYDADRPTVPLRKEMEFIDNYIRLMRIRYAGEVEIRTLCPADPPDVQVPPLMLITLTENAFKHGMSYREVVYRHPADRGGGCSLLYGGEQRRSGCGEGKRRGARESPEEARSAVRQRRFARNKKCRRALHREIEDTCKAMMRCIAIDDEPLALRQICSYIERTPFLRLAASCRSAVEAAAAMSDAGADLLFVDINMPGLSGLDFVRALPSRPLVIFTTAYSEYALEGFRVDATDYLLKPIGYADFLRSAERAYARFGLLKASSGRRGDDGRSLFVRSEYRTLRIDIADIVYVESMSEYVRIFPVSGRPVTTLGSLKSYEGRLPADTFMRVHRSYIVNLDRIVAVERKHIVLTGDKCIPVGDVYEDNFRRYLAERSLG